MVSGVSSHIVANSLALKYLVPQLGISPYLMMIGGLAIFVFFLGRPTLQSILQRV